MEQILIMVGQLLLALSILVGVHELGHMLTAKYFGMRVEKYSIGFPPKVFGFTKGETEYSLGAIPLGGFVKISGMIDESLDTESLSRPPEPWEFRAKPAWQRLIVMIGGITVNLIVGVVIFICLTYHYGEEYVTADEVNKRGIVAGELGQEIGLKTGDKILKVNGKDYSRFAEVKSPDVLLSDGSYYTVERDGKVFNVYIPKGFIGKLSSDKQAFIDPIIPFGVENVINGSNADKAGLKSGDEIVAVDTTPTPYFHQFQQALAAHKGQAITLNVKRGGENVLLKAEVDKTGKIGFKPKDLLPTHTQYFSLGGAAKEGTTEAFAVIINTVRGFGKIFKREISASDSISGPIGIAQQFGGEWVWKRFWFFTGLLSMVLAFMNILPIPALDGGHVMFLSYEIITGRKPSDKFMEISQKIGMVILLGLMVFAFGNDIYKSFR